MKKFYHTRTLCVCMYVRVCVIFEDKNNFALTTIVCIMMMALDGLNTIIIDNLEICLGETKLFSKPIVYCTIINKITYHNQVPLLLQKDDYNIHPAQELNLSNQLLDQSSSRLSQLIFVINFQFIGN